MKQLSAMISEREGKPCRGTDALRTPPGGVCVVREAIPSGGWPPALYVQRLGAGTPSGARSPRMKTGEGKTLVATLPLYLNAWRSAARISYGE